MRVASYCRVDGKVNAERLETKPELPHACMRAMASQPQLGSVSHSIRSSVLSDWHVSHDSFTDSKNYVLGKPFVTQAAVISPSCHRGTSSKWTAGAQGQPLNFVLQR